VEGVAQTGLARTINREKLALDTLMARLAGEDSVEHAVFEGYRHLLHARIAEPAFHPQAQQEILSLGDGIFGVLRRSPMGDTIIALHNVRGSQQTLPLDLSTIHKDRISSLLDILTGISHAPSADGELTIRLAPYQAMWLKLR
jgi:sucrose phosphorylase